MSIAKNTKETFLEEIVDNLNGNQRELPVDCKPRTREEVLLAEIEKNTRELNNTNEVEIDLSDYYTKSETDNLVKTNVKTMLDDSLNSNTTTWSSNKIIEYVDESNNPIFGEFEDTYISVTDSIDGAIQDIEIKGNTVQDPDNLSDIKSVGELQEDGTYKMSILSCGKNLLTLEKMWEAFNDTVDGTNSSSFDGDILSLKWNGIVRKANLTKIKFRENTRYTLSYWCKSADSGTWQRSMIRFEYTDGTISNLTSSSTSNTEFTKQTVTSLEGKTVKNIIVDLNSTLLINKIQLEEGTQATSYEPYQENKCDILLPCQLEKVGGVSDRLYYDDVEKAWCIEKNVGNITLDITKDWRFLSSNNTIWYPAKHDAKIWSQSIKSVAMSN